MPGAERAVWLATQAIRNDAMRPKTVIQMCKFFLGKPQWFRWGIGALFQAAKVSIILVFACGLRPHIYQFRQAGHFSIRSELRKDRRRCAAQV